MASFRAELNAAVNKVLRGLKDLHERERLDSIGERGVAIFTGDTKPAHPSVDELRQEYAELVERFEQFTAADLDAGRDAADGLERTFNKLAPEGPGNVGGRHIDTINVTLDTWDGPAESAAQVFKAEYLVDLSNAIFRQLDVLLALQAVTEAHLGILVEMQVELLKICESASATLDVAMDEHERREAERTQAVIGTIADVALAGLSAGQNSPVVAQGVITAIKGLSEITAGDITGTSHGEVYNSLLDALRTLAVDVRDKEDQLVRQLNAIGTYVDGPEQESMLPPSFE